MTYRAVVVTVSDKASQGDREDTSGPALESCLIVGGIEVVERRVVPDERDEIAGAIRRFAEAGVDLIVTTGGTGMAPRDVTPEATRDVIEREAPGVAELLRLEGLKKTPHAALSRGIAGIRAATLIVNLPGSRKAVEEGMAALMPVLGHALDTLRGNAAHHS